MADVSLLDVVKTMPASPERALLMVYTLSSHVLMTMPIANVAGGVDKFSMGLHLPYTGSSSAYRNFGAEYTATKTPTQKFTSSVKIAGGRVQADRALDKINPGEKSTQIKGQLAAQALQVTKDIFEGAGGTYLYGISQLIAEATLPYTAQIVDASNAVITPDLLDEALSKHNIIQGQTYIYMNQAPFRKIKKDSRGNVVASYNIPYRPEEYGHFAGVYDNLPLIITKDGKGVDYLSNATGSGASTSIYIVTYGADNFTGFQTGPAEILNMDAISVNKAFDLEWLIGTAAHSTQCITKIKSVKNAIS
jgi:hypothetical protein